jgi:hypothetical protein
LRNNDESFKLEINKKAVDEENFEKKMAHLNGCE